LELSKGIHYSRKSTKVHGLFFGAQLRIAQILILTALLALQPQANAQSVCADLFAPAAKSRFRSLFDKAKNVFKPQKSLDFSQAIHELSRQNFDPLRTFDDFRLYEYYEKHPEVVDAIVRKWYGDEYVNTWAPEIRKHRSEAWMLLLEPGVADRVAEFTRFISSKDNNMKSETLFELRNRFKSYLGVTRVYRGLLMTEQEASRVNAEGVWAPILQNSETKQNSLFTEAFGGPAEDITTRVNTHYSPHEKVSFKGLSISVTEFPEIGIAVANKIFKSFGRREDKKTYIVTIDIPEISLVRSTQNIMAWAREPDQAAADKYNKSQERYLVVDHRAYRMGNGEVEAFAFQGIPPEFIHGTPRLVEGGSIGFQFDEALTGQLRVRNSSPKRKFQQEDIEFFPN
jgi:hypothetical protein